MPVGIDVTKKINDMMDKEAQKNGVKKEGLAGVLLLLGLSNDAILRQALSLMKMYGLGGSVDMEKKGW